MRKHNYSSLGREITQFELLIFILVSEGGALTPFTAVRMACPEPYEWQLCLLVEGDRNLVAGKISCSQM